MTRAKKRLAAGVGELVIVIAGALVLAVAVQAFVVKPYRIPSGSMLPTLHINQRVLVNRIESRFSAPGLGDIVVFHPPAAFAQGCKDPTQGATGAGQRPCAVAGSAASSVTFIKRVVGLPGDRISVRAGHVIRNGKPEADHYITPCAGASSCNFTSPITIPHAEYYMMGDNRPDSEDSRFWGPVPKAWIIGQAFFTYWPPDRLGTL